MSHKDHVPLWILLLASIKVCYQIHVTNTTLNCKYLSKTISISKLLAFLLLSCIFFKYGDLFSVLLKRPNIRVLNYRPNAVNLTWDTEVTSEIDEYEICYNFSYRFLDKTTWKKVISVFISTVILYVYLIFGLYIWGFTVCSLFFCQLHLVVECFLINVFPKKYSILATRQG